MAKSKAFIRSSASIGDRAIEGLLWGVAAGIAMAVVLTVAEVAAGFPFSFAISRFDPTATGAFLPGLLAHLATAGIYGLVFAVLTGPVLVRLGNRSVVAGLIYGFLLLAVSYLVMDSEVGAPLRAFPAVAWSLAHVAYGATLGWLMSKR